MISNIFPNILPQITYDKFATWDYFLYKASTGSIHVYELLISAEMALVKNIQQSDAKSIDHPSICDDFLEQVILVSCPFKSLDELIKQLHSDNYFTIKFKSIGEQINNYEYYGSLWKTKLSVKKNELLYDSAYHVYHNWSAIEYCRLIDDCIGPDYNSLAAVSAMLMLLISFKEVV